MKVKDFLKYLQEDCEEYGDYSLCLTKIVVMSPETCAGEEGSEEPYEVVLDLPINGYAYHNDSKELRFLLTDREPKDIASYVGKEIRKLDDE